MWYRSTRKLQIYGNTKLTLILLILCVYENPDCSNFEIWHTKNLHVDRLNNPDEISFISVGRKKLIFRFQVTQRSIFQLVQAETNRHCENRTMRIKQSFDKHQSNRGESFKYWKKPCNHNNICMSGDNWLPGQRIRFVCSSEKLRQSIVNIYLINQSAIDWWLLWCSL